jgi:hypothetical protein
MLNNLKPIFATEEEPIIGLDLEGVNLGRRGEACVMQIADYLTGQNYLIDLQYLGQGTFTTTSSGNDLTWQSFKCFVKQKLFRSHPEDEIDIITSQQVIERFENIFLNIVGTVPDEHKISLKDIFESPRVKKLLWDVRMDSDALYAQFGVKLAGVWDVQLMRVYLNNFSRRPRLADSVRAEGILQGVELMTWARSKAYHYPRGYEEWRERPVSQILKAYAIGDVTPMKKMLEKLRPQLGVQGMAEVERMTNLLIAETWQPVYVSTRALSPWLEVRNGYFDGNGEWVSLDD